MRIAVFKVMILLLFSSYTHHAVAIINPQKDSTAHKKIDNSESDEPIPDDYFMQSQEVDELKKRNDIIKSSESLLKEYQSTLESIKSKIDSTGN